jgi:hypothetical protein
MTGRPYKGDFGLSVIAAERRRQIEAEQYTLEYDERHTSSELARAAICYVYAGWILAGGGGPRAVQTSAKIAVLWPFARAEFKPAEDAPRNLEKAGALIAAELDRLERLRVSEAVIALESGERAAERD